MPIVDGSPVNASYTNSQKIDRVGDDTASGVITLANALTGSGTTVNNTQQSVNSIKSFIGQAANTVYNNLRTWTSTNFGSNPSNLVDKIEAIDAAFSGAQAQRSGRISLTNGSGSQAVVFSSTFGTSDYVIDFSFENTVDVSPIWLQGMVIARSATGFSLNFNATIDSTNYILHYLVRAPT